MRALILTAILAAVSPAAASLREAATRLEAGDPAGVVGSLSGARGGAARYLLGRAAEIQKEWARAAEHHAQALSALPSLADEIGVRLGEASLLAGKARRAGQAFGAVLRQIRDRPSRFRERALLGAVEAECRWRGCAAGAKKLFELLPNGNTQVRTDALLAVARCHERAGDRAEAARLFQRIALLHPKSQAAPASREALADLKQAGIRPPPLSFADALAAARQLRAAGRLDEAEAQLASAQPSGPPEELLVRYERSELWHARGDHRAAAAGLRAVFEASAATPWRAGYLRLAARCLREIGLLSKAAEARMAAYEAAPGGAREGRDLWVAGDLFDLAGEPERAAKALLTLARRERDHRDAPHAHLKAAEVLLAHGKSSEAAKIAQSFPGRWSRRRVAWRARWLRAWATFRAGDAEPAARLLAAIASARSAPAQERRRARYWSARMAEARSRERAIRAYEELVRDEPQSFYADLAQGRLQALGVQGHAPMAAPIPVEPGSPPLSSAAEATGPPPPPAARGLDRVLLARLEKLVRKLGEDLPDLPRALTLYQVGLWAEAREALTLAQEELEKARLRPPRQRAFASTSPPNDPQSPAGQRRRRLARIDRAAFALALAPVFEKLGAPEHAQMNRRRFARAQEGRRARKQGPYPRAYEDLIQGASRAHGVSPALIFAVVRQESSFRTDALSPAGARGLLQIMPRTARRIAERLAETVDLKLLDDPAFSARYGAWYFQQLLEKYRGQVPLAIAAYNAGPRAVSRWLDARGSLPLDAFLEEIPFTETRRYVRKVIASARAYAQILGGKPGYYAQAHLDARYGDNIDF